MADVLERSVVACSDAAGVLERIGDPAVGLAIWRRRVPPDARAAALRLTEGTVGLRCVVSLEKKAISALEGHLARLDGASGPLAFDLALLARVFSIATGHEAFSLRLETVRDDGCARFHVDNVEVRMVTTYVGVGTQWVPDPDALILQSAYRRPVQALAPGDVALFRGKRRGGACVPHRSPRLAEGDVRLVAVLDPLTS